MPFINAAQGTFRWISGNSPSSAYDIVTPAGTLGLRGTALDFYVGRNVAAAVVLLNGAAEFCGAGVCKELKHRCDSVIATPNAKPTEPRRADWGLIDKLGEPRALPFLTGDQSLSGDFRANDGTCKFAKAALSLPPSANAMRAISPAPSSGHANRSSKLDVCLRTTIGPSFSTSSRFASLFGQTRHA
jgi:hypothetical protein